ncbi:centrosomal protein kizuna [Ochotona princeps]|uniref:centrosomal protein kizuna n=1 Tax=Ochotona princeps TaxID=9978 RepID=UPI002714762D|nr:centrosomal protein kizuna [Ochotona princeps]
MHRNPASSLPLATPDFYERLGHLQRGLRDSEKKRLDLEKKLCEYNQSDVYRNKLKYVKLKKYLKEICDSEKRAHARNKEYLQRLECVEARVGRLATNTKKLQELKIEYETQIKKMQQLSKDDLGVKDEFKDPDETKVALQAGINLGTAMSRGLYQPATIFMGRQMSAISSLADFSREQKSPQPTKNFSIPDPHSLSQTAQSRDVTDSCVVQTHSDTQCLKKSDNTDGKTSLPTGQRRPVTGRVLSEEERTHCSEIGGNPRLSENHLSVGEKCAQPHSLFQERLSPENRTDDFKCDSCSRSEESEGGILTQEHIEVEEARASPPVSPVSVPEHCEADSRQAREEHPAWRASSGLHSQGELQSPFQEVQDHEEEEESSSSSSDLTVSVSEDDLILKSPEPQPNPGDKMEGEDEIEALKLIHTKQKREALSTEEDKCAVQTVSSSGSEKESSTKSPTGESEQAPDSGLLKAQLGDVTLRERACSPQEATAFLREAFMEECADGSSIHSTDSSCSLPPILNDDPGRKEAKRPLELPGVHTREQEVSSDCGDERKEDSMAAAVPITETRVYQLLKMSALQDSRKQTEGRLPRAAASVSQPSGLHVGSSVPQTKSASSTASGARDSSGEGSPLSRNENKKKLIASLKSNVFWGESDDSNSDIEAALRPRNCDTSSDGFDDFYD